MNVSGKADVSASSNVHVHMCVWCGRTWSCGVSHDNGKGRKYGLSCTVCRNTAWGVLVLKYGIPKALKDNRPV